MPIYEYVCEKCENQFDALVLSSREPDPPCPKCKSSKVKKMMSAGNIIGGQKSGFSSGACAPRGGG